MSSEDDLCPAPSFSGVDSPLRFDGLEELVRSRLIELGADGSRLIVAFSGGTDSLALLLACARLEADGFLELHACHVDHGLDPDSGRRAHRARELAGELGLSSRFYGVRLRCKPGSGESTEFWAREQRYAELGKLADSLGCPWIATAHHADDQAETLVLRLLFGSGLSGLAGIRARRGRLIRPLLSVIRSELEAYVAASGKVPVEDPTNADLSVPRNQIRHGFWYEWKRRDPSLVHLLARVAGATERATERVDLCLAREIDIRSLENTEGAQLERAGFLALPEVLRRHALSALERSAGCPYPSSSKARKELFRQLGRGTGRVACDAGSGWRWYGDGKTLRLLGPRAQPLADFTYTLEAPGSVELVELGLRATVRRGRRASWMLDQHVDKAGFQLDGIDPAQGSSAQRLTFEIRNRRPGDRIQPCGTRAPKKLKDLLIDRRIPRERRDRLPIVVVEGRLIWVPGVALDESCRLTRGAANVWIIELQRLDQNPRTRTASASNEP